MSKDVRPEPQDGFIFTPSAEDWREYGDFLDSLEDQTCGESFSQIVAEHEAKNDLFETYNWDSGLVLGLPETGKRLYSAYRPTETSEAETSVELERTRRTERSRRSVLLREAVDRFGMENLEREDVNIGSLIEPAVHIHFK